MPPNKKAVAKAADKIVDDKTFGLKNKNKSKKVQAYVESVKKNVQARAANILGPKTEADKKREAEKKAKAAAEAAERELQALLRSTVRQPKLEPGVDPKSVLCEFFKAACCDKGEKCKYSHDLTIGRKAAKADIYSDKRDEKKDDVMEDWDQAKLESVVKTKHGAEKGQATKTEIVCMYFLDALEKELYGWFWECPNGGTCKYRHALPPGYVFKTKKQREAEILAKAAADKAGDSRLEELIEEERAKLPTTGLTPVTAETFAKWKDAKAARKAADVEAKRAEEAKKTGTKGYTALSGRALFSYDPSLFVDDAGADDEVYSHHEGEEEGEEEDEEEGEDEDGNEAGAAGGAGLDSGTADLAAAIDESVFLEGGADDLDDLDDDDEEAGGDDDDEGGGGGDGPARAAAGGGSAAATSDSGR